MPIVFAKQVPDGFEWDEVRFRAQFPFRACGFQIRAVQVSDQCVGSWQWVSDRFKVALGMFSRESLFFEL